LVVDSSKRLLRRFVQRFAAREDHVEHFVLSQSNISKLFLLRQDNCLQAHQFENRKQRDDHGVARRARLEKCDELDAFVRCDELLAEKLHHLRHGELVVAQIYFYHFPASLEDLLEDLHQIDQWTINSPSDSSPSYRERSGFDQTFSSICWRWWSSCAALLNFSLLDQAVD